MFPCQALKLRKEEQREYQKQLTGTVIPLDGGYSAK
jgi:hypothetical protein